MGHFQGQSVDSLISSRRTQVVEAVQAVGPELLDRPLSEFADELQDTYRLDPPTLSLADLQRIDEGEVKDPNLPAYARQPLRVVVAIPFTGQEGFFGIKPRTYSVSAVYDGVARDSQLILSVQMVDPTAEGIQREIDRKVAAYQGALAELQANVADFNATLGQVISGQLESRREKLRNDREVLAALPYAVRRRDDAVIPVPVKRVVHTSPVPKAKAAATQKFREVPTDDYEQIIGSTHSMGRVMERAPAAFYGLAEEGIRDFFLAVLNVGFKGEAVGEVFHGKGKTDIYIAADEDNVFIAECKVWAGPASCLEALEQLLGNTGWRDTKTAILLFVHERDVTKVMEAADATVRDHGCYLRNGRDAGRELERRYVLHWPGDTKRELHLALQVFAVPHEKPTRTARRSAKS